MELTIRIGGEAGQGLQLIGTVLTTYFKRLGYHVFTHQDYMSRVRGGHNFYQIRLADKPVCCSRQQVDLLLALDSNTIDLHEDALSQQGRIIYDSEMCKRQGVGRHFLDMPFTAIVKELAVAEVMVNSAAVGAVIGILGLDLQPFAEIIADFIGKKGTEVVTTNIKVAQAGHDHAVSDYAGLFSLPAPEAGLQSHILINGSQAMGLGALMSGCKFYSAYPMTPSTGIMVFLAAKAAEHGLVVEQAEDEIAAINMALGASYAGVRAMTGTSGGGYALMTEGVSLAGITETPIVIAEVQRPGPATGLPTRTEQSDLFFVLYGGHGEFPRVVFTPGTPEQAFYLTNKAFHLAEKYQIPVIVQSDQYLADCQWTLPEFAEEGLLQEDFRLRGQALQERESYQRYGYSDSGITPLAVPGASRHLVVVDSDEHDEDGHIIEDAETRNRMMTKRLFNKLPLLQAEMTPPEHYGAAEPDFLLIGYGSTWGLLKEVVDHCPPQKAVAMLHFSEVWPLPLSDTFDYVALLEQATTICVENNATSQFATLLHSQTGHRCTHRINRFDGRPFTLDNLMEALNDYLC